MTGSSEEVAAAPYDDNKPSGHGSSLPELRQAVREYLHRKRECGRFVPAVDGWLSGWDAGFSRDLARQGWVGMTIPTQYGGGGRTFVERFAVNEELLMAGAPVMAHWVADRQIAPALLRYGTKQQKRYFLPRIARGDFYFSIGMSEPDAGSDLASVRTRADPTDGGWSLHGTKVWTSGAHRSNAMVVLARTSPAEPDRHAGLSQFIVDLRAPQVQIKPIRSMSGEAHFNEVHFDGAFVPTEMVLGTVGNGWRQVTAELGYERSGPERFLSTFPLLSAIVGAMNAGALPATTELGQVIARLSALHHLSLAVSEALQRDEPAVREAASVKVLGTTTEGEVAELGDRLGAQSSTDHNLTELTRQALVARPGFTLRGGTNEILRSLIASELGVK